MYNSLLVHVIDGLQDLSDESRSILLRIRSLLNDSIEKFTASYSVGEENEMKQSQSICQ